jgi:LemA protein
VTALWIILGIVVLLGIIVAVSYNRFVSQRQLIRNSFANIDTELRRRYDLIPNLVETVKGYASHEREVFEEVARTRAAAAATSGQSPATQAQAEGPFVAALGRLFAVAENYPELKANQNFLALQGELTNTEDRIQASRRFYNANVADYNRRVQSFPSAFIASMFRFTVEEFFEIPEGERATVGAAPTVDFGSRQGPPPAGAPADVPPSLGSPPAGPPPATPPAPPPPAVPPPAAPPPVSPPAPATPPPGSGGPGEGSGAPST